MWAFRVESFGNYGCIVPCGNDGQQQLHCKSLKGIYKETEYLRKRGGQVYVLSDFTQRMCELSPKQFADYVMTHYIYKL